MLKNYFSEQEKILSILTALIYFSNKSLRKYLQLTFGGSFTYSYEFLNKNIFQLSDCHIWSHSENQHLVTFFTFLGDFSNE